VSTPREWLSARVPPPPPPLAAWLEAHEPAGPAGPAVLSRAGLAALDRVRARPGRVRDSAFELLGADAFLTYACEAALELEDPLAVLDALTARVAVAP